MSKIEWPRNGWIASALNVLTDSCMYRATHSGIHVNIIGRSYDLTNEEALVKLRNLVSVIENYLPGVKENLQCFFQEKVNDSLEELSLVS